MKWIPAYEIGIEEIDSQHKRLFELLEFVKKSLAEGLVTRKTGLAIKELVEYTSYHFEAEEKIMESHNFPFLLDHKAEHKRLINELKGILLRLKNGNEITSLDLLNFLTKWIVDHILDEDLKFREHLQPGFKTDPN